MDENWENIPNFNRGQYFSQYILFRLHIFLYILAKIFNSLNIFEEISIFKGLWNFLKILKNLRLCLYTFFWTRRFFVFGLFSIFVATLTEADFAWVGPIWPTLCKIGSMANAGPKVLVYRKSMGFWISSLIFPTSRYPFYSSPVINSKVIKSTKADSINLIYFV